MIEGFTGLSRRFFRFYFDVLSYPSFATVKGTFTIGYRAAAGISATNVFERHGEHDFAEAGLLPTKPITRSASAIRQAAPGLLQTKIVMARDKCLFDIRVSYSRAKTFSFSF